MNDERTAREMLNAIPCADLDYQGWLNVGMALHHEGLPCALWEEWSRDDSRYHPGECERKWKTFGSGSTVVTLGTVYHMATERGWTPAQSQRTYSWDDIITTDDDGWHREDTVQQLPAPPVSWSPVRDIVDYLEALYDDDDKVSFTLSAYKDEDGKWKPQNGTSARTRAQLLASIRKHPDRLDDTFGTPNPEAGAWICPNPTNGEGRKNASITAFRWALVESDTMSIDEQYAAIQDLRLPVRMLVHSGGKSLHAIVHIDAADYAEYNKRVDFLYTVCRRHGMMLDTQNKNPARLSRFPGFMRGEKRQYIVARDLGLPSWSEWEQYIREELVAPLDVVNLESVWENLPPVKPVLIDGILRQGHKLLISSSSKAGKSFALIELAIAIAEGRRWLGFPCKKGRVLYINLEIDEASFLDRMKRVYEEHGIQHPSRENIDTVHLRGKAETLDKLIPQIVQTAKKGYTAIILDPIYKLGIVDENAASEVAKFCNAMDKLANTGASVIYSHHHSKGSQGSKAAMDRASGSGVFARDADALLDLIELNIDDRARERIEELYGDKADKVTAWRMDTTLREFARIDPVDLFFVYPVHEIDTEGIMADAMLAETERVLSDGREKNIAGMKAKKESAKARLYELIKADEELTGRRRTQVQYAEDLGITERTVRTYLREMEG